MNKIKFISIILLTIIIMNNPIISFADEIIDTSKLELGVIEIKYESNKTMAIILEKENEKEIFILHPNNVKSIPLLLGDGEYNIYILEQKQDTMFTVLKRLKINVKIPKDKITQMYLQPINIISFDKNMVSIIKANELTKQAESDEEKLKIIYNYIVKNIKYDNEFAEKIPTNYVPILDNTFKTNKGICYDYASLTASMLRSLGIPTKLVKGYTVNIEEYHAWNEVFIDGEWKIIDTTYDAAFIHTNKKVEMYKNIDEYNNVTRKY